MYQNYPFDVIVTSMQKHMAKGNDVYMKFTCDRCGSRQTIAEKNKAFTRGKCEECGHVTNIVEHGCNFLVYGNPDTVLGEIFKK